MYIIPPKTRIDKKKTKKIYLEIDTKPFWSKMELNYLKIRTQTMKIEEAFAGKPSPVYHLRRRPERESRVLRKKNKISFFLLLKSNDHSHVDTCPALSPSKNSLKRASSLSFDLFIFNKIKRTPQENSNFTPLEMLLREGWNFKGICQSKREKYKNVFPQSRRGPSV